MNNNEQYFKKDYWNPEKPRGHRMKMGPGLPAQ